MTEKNDVWNDLVEQLTEIEELINGGNKPKALKGIRILKLQLGEYNKQIFQTVKEVIPDKKKGIFNR